MGFNSVLKGLMVFSLLCIGLSRRAFLSDFQARILRRGPISPKASHMHYLSSDDT